MKRRYTLFLASTIAAAALLAACAMGGSSAPRNKMSFFITSANPGKGGDFGGLAGADRHCQSLAESVGAGGRTWRAYLSTTATAGTPAVNARDRIGNGPWVNVKGVTIANNLEELHGTNNIDKQTGLTEKGEIVSASGDPVNNHDILTGSMPDGRASTDISKDTTCGNWTQSGEGSAIVGHHNRMGTNAPPASMSWNSSHATRGCSLEALRSTGGAGLMYCFAAN
ncbi:Collagenase NC10 and Endostatin [Variovorax sp. HW608]|uniref:hypothetical protein n=1 Tax=Variovorax sp. HW608 TaxID=1034889 RepID=UPI00081FD27B|nr:hypothetical protein [Variovorax sp. HW608]SCK45617.1 Collagenase NC10 and Endostatin [Variovorax sp. HW608]